MIRMLALLGGFVTYTWVYNSVSSPYIPDDSIARSTAMKAAFMGFAATYGLLTFIAWVARPEPKAETPVNVEQPPAKTEQVTALQDAYADQAGELNLAGTLPRRSLVASVRCWQCKKDLPITPENRGRLVKCAGCGTKQNLPH